jgi:hypothetical protein
MFHPCGLPRPSSAARRLQTASTATAVGRKPHACHMSLADAGLGSTQTARPTLFSRLLADDQGGRLLSGANDRYGQPMRAGAP